MSRVEIAAFEALLTPDGQALLADIGDVDEAALLATASRLRDRHPADLVGAALTQARLRMRARPKFGSGAARMYFTPHGLEQATRTTVAAHRADRFAGLQGVLDLSCGIGGDLLALGRAGVRVTGVDRDPLTVAVARANVRAFGLEDLVSVRLGDATEQDTASYAAVFADPGRRTARGRVFDPKAYEPPLDTVLELAGRAGAACVKVAPGIPHEAIPAHAEAEWISDTGEVKEAALWLGALAGPVRHRATLLNSRGTATLVAGDGAEPPPVGNWGRYLYEPDGAVIRAHLVAEVVALVDGTLADPNIAYVTSDHLVRTPFATAYEIDEVLPFSLKRLRTALRARDAGPLTIKKRGSAVDVERLRRDLRTAGRTSATVVLTRVGTAPYALICRPA